MTSCSICNPPTHTHDWYAVFCEAEHPHADYNYCRGGCKEYLGTNRWKSNCASCNPDLVCQHTGGNFWADDTHPHAIWCRDCSALVAPQGSKSGCTTCYPPQGNSAVTITASTSLTSVTDSGVLSIEYEKEVNDSFSYSASVSGNDTLKSIVCSGPQGTSSTGLVALNNNTLGTYTITATTNKGAVRTISVTVKTQSAAIGDISFRTVGINVKRIYDPNNTQRSAGGSIRLEGASVIPQSEYAKIASMVGRYDGLTYQLNGSLVIEVRNNKTSKVLGTFDVEADIGALLSGWGWGASTIADFQTMQSTNIAYQAPKKINATATYCSQDKSTVFGAINASSVITPDFIFPYETKTISFSAGAVGVDASKWEYHGAQWLGSPTLGSGSAIGQTTVTDTFTSAKSSASYYFYWKEKVTKGSITVNVRSSSGGAILGATVSLGGKSGGSGSTFSELPFGTYTASASAPGYYSGSATGTISSSTRDTTITVVLTPVPIPEVTLSVTPIIDGTYRMGSKVMVAAYISSDVNMTRSSPAKVSMTATYAKKEGSSYKTENIGSQTKDVVVPAGDKNIVWFELTLPSGGYYTNRVNITYVVSAPAGYGGYNRSRNVDINVVDIVSRGSPNSGYEELAPDTYARLNRKTSTGRTLTWSVWEHNGSSFNKRNFSVKLNHDAILKPDVTAGYSKYSNTSRLWTTRSGYSVNTELTVKVENLAGMIVGKAGADIFYPEFNYSDSAVKSDNLVHNGGGVREGEILHEFVFKQNTGSISKNRMHLIPIWFPDGEYTVCYSVYDIWTPVGELTSSTYATVNIDGSMYDDSYAPPR